MAATEYNYTISTDIPAAAVSETRLAQEIAASAITVALDDVSVTADALTITFKNELPSADKTILDNDTTGPCGGLLGSHSGEPLPDPTTSDGIPKIHVDSSSWTKQNDGSIAVVPNPRIGTETIKATHDFTDPTTWYQESVRVTDEVATGSGTTWDVTHENIIDLVHGKILDEEIIVDGIEHGYGVVVTVDDVEKTMRPPFATDWSQGGDYYVDYENGQIIFQDSQTGTIEVSYSYANGSNWKLAPNSGKIVRIENAETQFSADAVYNDTIRFYIKGYVIIFAPELAESNGGPYPDYDLIVIAETKYKTMNQIIDEAIGAFPVIPAISGVASRGTTQQRYGFPFKYSTTRDLYNSWGMELWVGLENDEEFGGERVTATFYCTVSDE